MTGISKLAALSSLIAVMAASSGAAMAENLKVVASFSIIADLAKNVGGDRIELSTLVGANGDTHAYEPKPADAAIIAAADVVLVNGLHLEGFLPRLLEASGTKGTVVEVSKSATLLEGADHETHEGEEHAGEHSHEADGHEHGPVDPHAWQSVRNVETYVGNIAAAFCAADAAGCDAYKANAEAYSVKLRALDDEVMATLGSIPADKRTIITSHDAFAYLADAYGLKFVAPQGVATDAEASAADVAALIRQVRDAKASAIFVENIANPRLIEQIANETGLKLGGELYSDALSDASGPAATYIDMMRHNAMTIKGAVEGS